MTITDKRSYKVLIPTAGTGSRLGEYTKYLNKSLVDISCKPAISRIIDMFSENCSFVIPLGYKGELVKQFLTLAYPKRKFYFPIVEKYEGEGSGLGLTILSAEQYLQEPFIFCSCDTIAEGEISYPDKNIMGVSGKENKNQYRTADFDKNGKVTAILEKGEAKDTSMPYIGLASINDWKLFWQEMHNGGKEAIETGESYPLKKFAKNGNLFIKEYKWFDTGNIEELKKTKEYFKNDNLPNILPKPDEAIWFVGNNVIKFSNNKSFITERIERTKYLKDFVPKIIASTENMYAYRNEEGEVLSKIKNLELFKKLLNYAKTFWLPMQQPINFKEICKKFYYDKTFERLELYYKTFSQNDNETVINGKKYQKISEILNKIDWENIFNGLAGNFHGDFHFENILYNAQTDKFIFLDWRQNFGGLLNCGDIYYDLAKLLHGLIICHELIAQNRYNIEIKGNIINYSFERKPILIECEQYYYNWLQNNGYDIKKVKQLTALIYLNIAALHHAPYCHLLYYLGKTMLNEIHLIWYNVH